MASFNKLVYIILLDDAQYDSIPSFHLHLNTNGIINNETALYIWRHFSQGRVSNCLLDAFPSQNSLQRGHAVTNLLDEDIHATMKAMDILLDADLKVNTEKDNMNSRVVTRMHRTLQRQIIDLLKMWRNSDTYI
jgi:hypothetical protein